MAIACPPESRLYEAATSAGLPTHPIQFPSFRSPLRFLHAVRDFRRSVRWARPRALVANASRAGLIMALSRGLSMRGWPTTGHVMHDLASADLLALPVVIRSRDPVFAVGALAATRYAERLPRRRVSEIRNFLDADTWPWYPRASGPPSSGQARIAVIARLVPEKGLVEVVGELAACRSDWGSAVIAGTGSSVYAARLQQAVDDAGLGSRIDLIGESVAQQVLARADVVVVPSVGPEAQPTVILEALISGLPCVIRQHIWCLDYEGLPVFTYGAGQELGESLRRATANGRSLDTRVAATAVFSPEAAVRVLANALALHA